MLSMSTGSTVESQPGRVGKEGMVRRPRCGVQLPFYQETQRQQGWGWGQEWGMGSVVWG